MASTNGWRALVLALIGALAVLFTYLIGAPPLPAPGWRA